MQTRGSIWSHAPEEGRPLDKPVLRIRWFKRLTAVMRLRSNHATLALPRCGQQPGSFLLGLCPLKPWELVKAPRSCNFTSTDESVGILWWCSGPRTVALQTAWACACFSSRGREPGAGGQFVHIMWVVPCRYWVRHKTHRRHL